MNPRELFTLSLIVGIVICSLWAVVYPYIPKLKIKNVELFPSIVIQFKTKIIHLHHWFYYLIILSVSIFIDSGVLASIPVRGYLTGAILKEFLLPSKKKGSVPRKLIFKVYNR